MKLYVAETILDEKDRSEELTQLVVQMLDEVESFKSQVTDEGTKILLHDQTKALAFVMNLAMSVYNGILVQIHDGRVDSDLGKGLWCCIDLFQCCKHLWSNVMDQSVVEQCDKGTKHAKYYLMKLKRGELSKGEESSGKEEKTFNEQSASVETPSVEMDALGPSARDVETEEVEEPPAFLEEDPDIPSMSGLSLSRDSSSTLEASSIQQEKNESIADGQEVLPSEATEHLSMEQVDKEASPEPVRPIPVAAPYTAKKHDVAALKKIMTREETISHAQRSAKYAISALNYEDTVTAKAELQEALRLIETL